MQKCLKEKGYNIFATEGTSKFFLDNGVENTLLYWPDEEGSTPNTLDYLQQKKIDLVINIPKNHTKRELNNGYMIRRNSIDFNIPLITNARVASAFIYGICKYKEEDMIIKSWDEIYQLKKLYLWKQKTPDFKTKQVFFYIG